MLETNLQAYVVLALCICYSSILSYACKCKMLQCADMVNARWHKVVPHQTACWGCMQRNNQKCRLGTSTVPENVYGHSVLHETGDYTLPIDTLIFSMMVGNVT